MFTACLLIFPFPQLVHCDYFVKQNCKIFKYKTSSHIRYFTRTKVNKSTVDKDVNRSVHNRCRPVDISYISSLGFLQTTMQLIKDGRVLVISTIGIGKSHSKSSLASICPGSISKLRKIVEYFLRQHIYFKTYSPTKCQKSAHNTSHSTQVRSQLS